MTRKSNNAALNQITEHQNSGLLDNAFEKTITYVSGTTGAVGATTLATVTGMVALQIVADCSVSLVSAGAGTLEVGTALSTAGLIAQTTATDIDINEIWHDATPDSSIELTSVILSKIVTQNVIQTIGTGVISAGAITYYIRWSPISADGNVVVA